MNKDWWFWAMANSKNKPGVLRPVWLIPLALVGVGLIIFLLMRISDVALLSPKGLIAREQLNLMTFSITVLLFIAIPTLFLVYFFAWRYRETNDKVAHDPNASRGKLFAFGVWVIPAVVVVILSSAVLPATFSLDPHKAIASNTAPLTIQVIALRWKWLFVYPAQNIATVNFVQIPVGTPVQFELTADQVPMSSFWIPHLGGQLYAMTGMDNRINLMADTAGDFSGASAEINGAGFAGMKFTTRASSIQDFDGWVQNLKSSSDVLDVSRYNKLLAPSEYNPASYYSWVVPGLYERVILKYMNSSGSQAVAL
ncbi:MAG: COX aromatic rich motif-containing protein [Candidatus Saccharimonadia bacterium]